MLFHLGTLWRLNEVGYLRRLKRVSSVSGGSITAGVVGLAWKRLRFDPVVNCAKNFEELVVNPVMKIASHTIDIPAILLGFLPGTSAAKRIGGSYRRHLFGHATLRELPTDAEGPRFVINATNMQDKVLWRFSRPFMGDYRVGLIRDPDFPLATAVAASSAFPPFLSPIKLRVRSSAFDPRTSGGLQHSPYDARVVLTDGGVYDNLGLETVWKRCDTILVSDGGGAAPDDPRPKSNWICQVYRVLNIFDNQVGSLRKRQVIASFELQQRAGAYWGIRTDIRNYKAPSTLPCPFEQTMRLASTPTRLAAMPDLLKKRLINWGYAVCDAAIRSHLDTSLPAPLNFPFPSEAVG